ncbi:hypothetical protein P8452_47409 [Trifolium repens]|nr:hypothetical protein P8452_47409 [Trifolium repens]
MWELLNMGFERQRLKECPILVKKGHFEKRKRTTTKAKKQNKEKQNEDILDGMTMNNHVTEPINVLNCTDESFRMTHVSLNAPVQEPYNHSWLPPSSSTQDKQG